MKTVFYSSFEAEKLLSDDNFIKKWQVLYESCQWSTFFQSADFIKTWFENYQEKFDLFFICSFAENEKLQGLFAFAQEKKTNRICVAGDYLAEYQTWLADENSFEKFTKETLKILSEKFPNARIEFPFIAPKTPLNFFEIDEKWSKQTSLRQHERPLIMVGGGQKAEESLQKKGNKTRLRQLKKIGEIEFEILNKTNEIEKVFDEIENFSKLRLSALHNVLPEKDTNKKEFYLALAKKKKLFASLLKVGGKIASAQVFVENQDEMLLSITAMSPFFAQQSPTKLQTYFVWKDFAEKGIEVFDLSPGGGYKNRFATDCEEVFSLEIFFDKKEFLRYKYRRKFVQFSKETLEKARFTKTKVFALADKINHKLKRVKRRTIPKTIWKNVRRKIYEFREVRVYMMDVEEIAKLPKFDLMKENSLEDLLKYSPSEGWQFTVSEFHKVCLKRFEEGDYSFTFADEEKLLHFGWLVDNQEISNVYEVEQEMKLPPNSSVLYDFFTHPEARRKGFYKKSLCQILHEIAKKGKAKQVFISVLADNVVSRSVIEKVGFTYQGSLYKETRFGKIKKWQNFSNNIDFSKNKFPQRITQPAQV